MRPFSILAGLLLLLLTVSAHAAEGTPLRVRGTVEQLDANTLRVVSREGENVAVTLAEGFQVSAVERVALADIKEGDFVGVAALPGTDGMLHAQEVVVFPEAARGAGEGHREWDLTPGSTMTNATVAEVARTEGLVLTVKYKDGEKTIAVAEDTPIVTLVPAGADLLTPGTAVFILATRTADGNVVAERVVAGKDGIDPPM